MGEFSDKSGNLVGCRVYYVGVVGFGVIDEEVSANVKIYCFYVGLLGGDVCGSWC